MVWRIGSELSPIAASSSPIPRFTEGTHGYGEFMNETTPHVDDPAVTANDVPTEPTLMEILADYGSAGFSADAFATEEGTVICGVCGATTAAPNLEVHSIRRLEGESDPADMTGVLAVICPSCDARSTIVLRFGPEASPGEQRLWQESADRRDSEELPGDATPGEAAASAPETVTQAHSARPRPRPER